MSEEDRANKIWVNTDENKVEWHKNFPPMFSFGDIKEKLSGDWESLRRAVKRHKK
jgi:hypothetical protein